MRFISDHSPAVRFWYDKRENVPALCGVSCRVHATPVSPSASERVFSALKLVVTDSGSRMRSENVQNVIVSLSLYSQLDYVWTFGVATSVTGHIENGPRRYISIE